MNFRTTLATAAFAVVALIPGVALAENPQFGVTVSLPPVELHAHSQACRHGQLPPAPPSGIPQQTGRYELQTVQNWVPGYYEQVRIPGQCFTQYKRHHTKTVCSQDRYESRWVEGRYEQVQQWVWVDYSNQYPQYRYGNYQNYQQDDDDDDHDGRNGNRFGRGYARNQHGASRVR